MTSRRGAPSWPTDHPLDNPAWHALTTHHAAFAEVAGGARRYQPDVGLFYAVGQFDDDTWADLETLAGPGAVVVLFPGQTPAVPAGWEALSVGAGNQLVLEELDEVDAVPVVRLGAGDVPEMLELAGLTEPGPFFARTIELGAYWGHRASGRLVAMAGERYRLDGWTEVSAVCTHPDFRGRGLAAALTQQVARGILDRGDTPFLHVADENDGARRVYERLGFVLRRQVPAAVVRTPGSP